MKSRLSASISLLNLGEQGRSFCFTNAFSSSLNFVLFNGRRPAFSRCQYQGFQSSRTVSYSSDDDFADLGPPSEGLATQLKLLTQKPELKVRNGPKIRGLSRSSSRESALNIYSIWNINKPSQTSNSIVKDCDNLSGRHGDMKNPSNLDSSCSVTVEDVTNEVVSCDSNFQENGPKTKGLSRSSSRGSAHNIYSMFRKIDMPSQISNSIAKDCYNLSRRHGDMKNPSNLDSPCSVMVEDVTNEVASCDNNFQMVTIRIQGIAKKTTVHIIHCICKSIGALEGLVNVDDAVDVLFRVKNHADSQYIVKRLNDTVIDGSQWSAFDLPKISTSSSSGKDARSKTGLQINSHLHDMKQRFNYKKVVLEDLLTLHLSVMHLEDLPTSLDPQNQH